MLHASPRVLTSKMNLSVVSARNPLQTLAAFLLSLRMTSSLSVKTWPKQAWSFSMGRSKPDESRELPALQQFMIVETRG